MILGSPQRLYSLARAAFKIAARAANTDSSKSTTIWVLRFAATITPPSPDLVRLKHIEGVSVNYSKSEEIRWKIFVAGSLIFTLISKAFWQTEKARKSFRYKAAPIPRGGGVAPRATAPAPARAGLANTDLAGAGAVEHNVEHRGTGSEGRGTLIRLPQAGVLRPYLNVDIGTRPAMLYNGNQSRGTPPRPNRKDDTMNKLNKTQLQAMATDHGLDAGGTKAQLVERIAAAHEALAAMADDAPKALPTMHALRKARQHYVTVTNGSKASVCCGDDLAVLLAPLDHLQVAALASIFAGEDLAARYAHLNNGQVRMNSGNRLRGLVKAGKESVAGIRQAAEEMGLIAQQSAAA